MDKRNLQERETLSPVSYTHLDVYKRQVKHSAANFLDQICLQIQ